MGRYTAASINLGRGKKIPAGTLLTPDLVTKIKNNKSTAKVVVRSPMRCAHGKGVCKKCMGLDETGHLPDKGTNVGVMAAQALGERGTQLAMKAFHCFANDSTVLARVDGDLVEMTTMERLFEERTAGVAVEAQEEVISVPPGALEVWDGEWVGVSAMRRHAPSRAMVLVRAGAGVLISQDNHLTAVKDPQGKIAFAAPEDMSESTELFTDLSWCASYGDEENDPEFDPYLVGMYVTKGWIGYQWTNATGVGKPYSIGMEQKPGPIREKLLSVIPRSWSPQAHGDTIEVHRLELGRRFEAMFGRYSGSVSLPSRFIHFSDDWFCGFLSGLIDGGGTVTESCQRTYVCVDTTSFELIQQLAVIATRIGARFSVAASTVHQLTRMQGFRFTFWLTSSLRLKLSASIKVSSVERTLVEDVHTESVGFSQLEQVKPVFYDRPFVYDLTTESSQLVVGGLLSHNSGGVYEGKDTKSLTSGGLDRAEDLLYLKKKVKGSATLATSSGKIQRIKKDPAGGYRVKIGNTEDYIPADRARLSSVRAGQSVRKGDPLTKGPVNPHELLPLVGMSKTQGHLASELHGIYGKYGIRRRNSELMVRALSSVTKVEDPGSNPDLLPGDFTSTTQVYDWNKKNKKGSPVKHTPVLRGVKQIPLDVQEDWMARLNHEHLRSTIIEASQQGWSSDLHGLNPIPPLVHGVEFGKGTKDKPWRY